MQWTPADHYLVVGSATAVFRHRAVGLGLSPERITQLECPSIGTLVEQLQHLAGESAVVMGMGNILGPGLALADYYRRRHTVDASSTQPAFGRAA